MMAAHADAPGAPPNADGMCAGAEEALHADEVGVSALLSELVVYREDDVIGVDAHRTEHQRTKRTSRISAGGSSSTSMRLNLSNGLNILNMVGMTGFEPATP